MDSSEHIVIAQHAIQLAIAPVFLLSGIGSLLAVMAGRLARIVDRARWYEQKWPTLTAEDMRTARLELSLLERRRHCSNWAINCCTTAALLLCLVIVTLFFEEFLAVDLKWVAGVEFVTVMIALIVGLTGFMREVYLATHFGRIDIHRATGEAEKESVGKSRCGP